MTVSATTRRALLGGDGIVRQRVGPTIKDLRAKLGVSLNVLAGEAGISPSHLSRIERGLTVPSYDVLDRIADALGSDLRALRADEEAARDIDGELTELFDEVGFAAAARSELLRLSHSTREELAKAFRSARSTGSRLGAVASAPARGDD